MKINNVLTTCHDQEILSAVRSIIQNMIACEDTSQQQLHYLQSCGFGGLWRFAGPFNKVPNHYGNRLSHRVVSSLSSTQQFPYGLEKDNTMRYIKSINNRNFDNNSVFFISTTTRQRVVNCSWTASKRWSKRACRSKSPKVKMVKCKRIRQCWV